MDLTLYQVQDVIKDKLGEHTTIGQLRRWAREGRLPAFKSINGSQWLVDDVALADWITEQKRKRRGVHLYA